MTTPPGSGDQPQTPGQGWGQQPPNGQQPAGQQGPGQTPGDQPQQGQWAAPGGQPQQPGQPQQFGQPGQQQFGQPGQQPWGAPGQPEQPKQKSAVARILPIVAGVVVVIVVGILVRSFLGGPSADVGDCLNDSLTEIGAVSCSSDEAAFRVVKVVEDTTQADLISGSECTDFPNATNYAFEGDTSGGEGTGYCLEPIS